MVRTAIEMIYLTFLYYVKSDFATVSHLDILLIVSVLIVLYISAAPQERNVSINASFFFLFASTFSLFD